MYLAPEYLQTSKSEYSNDVWAVGVMFHQVIFGGDEYILKEIDKQWYEDPQTVCNRVIREIAKGYRILYKPKEMNSALNGRDRPHGSTQDVDQLARILNRLVTESVRARSYHFSKEVQESC